MSKFIERRAAPPQQRMPALLDLMHEGFHLLSMLRNGAVPPAEAQFAAALRAFLDGFASQARAQNAASEDIEAARYAFCAALDEIILGSSLPLRAAWERRPLQLLLFGDQLAGEHFFDKLEQLRIQGAARLPALQVFHMCLLLGFQGRYAVEGGDRLAYLTARLGDEIAHLRGAAKGFAPRAARPDNVAHRLRSHAPQYAAAAVLLASGALSYGAMLLALRHETGQAMAAYQGIVQQPPRPASLTLTLP